MKPPWWMKISFKKKEPSFKGTIRGGWIEVPPNGEVGLPINTYVYIAWPMRILIFMRILKGVKISLNFKREK
jgi:hypothetical protein